jgi:hypothetical protein
VVNPNDRSLGPSPSNMRELVKTHGRNTIGVARSTSPSRSTASRKVDDWRLQGVLSAALTAFRSMLSQSVPPRWAELEHSCRSPSHPGGFLPETDPPDGR